MWPIVLQTIEWGAKPQRNTKFLRCSYNGLLYLTLNQKDPGSNPGRRTKQISVSSKSRTVAPQAANRIAIIRTDSNYVRVTRKAREQIATLLYVGSTPIMHSSYRSLAQW